MTLEFHLFRRLHAVLSGKNSNYELLRIVICWTYNSYAALSSREKIVPSVCEFHLEIFDEQRLVDAKFKATVLSKPLTTNDSFTIVDPFSVHPDPQASKTTALHSLEKKKHSGEKIIPDVNAMMREVQPFCHPTMMPTFGLTGCGPVAVSYINALYVYPIHVDKFQFRNIAVRVQLLSKEIDAVVEFDSPEVQDSVLRAVYGPDRRAALSGFTQVNYHQKNPHFESEIKICLPEKLTEDHHILFTFYHVHCKKILPHQQQQELVGYSAIPILQKDGSLLLDSNYVVNVTPVTAQAKAPHTSGRVSLPSGYVASARGSMVDVSKTSFTCHTRALSSIHSQDKPVAAFLQLFHEPSAAHTHRNGTWSPSKDEDLIVNRLLDLRNANTVNVRYFFFPIAKFVLSYLRFGSAVVRWAAFRAFLAVLEKANWTPHRSLRAQDRHHLLLYFVQIVFDERVIVNPARTATPKCSSPSNVSRKQPESVFEALLVEWLALLRDNTPTEDVMSTKRISLTYSNVLLQLILKSMAMNCDSPQLPSRLSISDEILLEQVLHELMSCVNMPSLGLLNQKDINRSIACFCKGMFIVTTNSVPARVITRYITAIDGNQRDANVLVHHLFPFLRILMEFELFAEVNRSTLEDCTTVSSPWLARLIFEKLLAVVDEQVEDKIRAEALRLLRRMFAAQVYNARYQTPEQQEHIALMYFPMFAHLAQFTSPGKLLGSGSVNSEPTMDKASDLRKELLVCVVHLLSSVSTTHLQCFFQQCAPQRCSHVSGETPASPRLLIATATLLHYRNVVRNYLRGEAQMTKIATKAFDLSSWHDEIHVHACLGLLWHVIDAFLLVEDSPMTWQRLLCPDLSAHEGRRSLIDLELHLNNRRSHYRIGMADSTSSTITTATSGNSSPKAHATNSANSFSSRRASTQRSLPRSWGGKNSVPTAQRRGSHSDTLKRKSSSSGTGLISRKSIGNGGNTEDFELQIKSVLRITASTVLRTLQTAVDRFEPILRAIEAPFDTPHDAEAIRARRSSPASLEEALTLLGALTDLIFFLLKRSTGIECLYQNDEDEVAEGSDQGDETGKGEQQTSVVADVFAFLEGFLLRFQVAIFATRATDLPLFHDEERIKLLLRVSTSAKCVEVQQQAAYFLCRMLAVCYTQTGSFELVKRSLFKVFSANFFKSSDTSSRTCSSSNQLLDLPCLPSAPEISCVALHNVLTMMMDYSFRDDDRIATRSFRVQFKCLLQQLSKQVSIYEQWFDVVTATDAAATYDSEVIADALYCIMDSISPYWLLHEKQQWMNALLRLQLLQRNFAEAACCKLSCIAFTTRVLGSRHGSNTVSNEETSWTLQELRLALQYAAKASWLDQQLIIGEQLLQLLKRLKRYREYQEMLREIDQLMASTDDLDNPHGFTCGFSLYRVVLAGKYVEDTVAECEFVYKRSKFTSLGEFVSDLKTALLASHSSCDRVELVPEAKAFPEPNKRSSSTVYLRVTTLEVVESDGAGALFQFATPFTLGSASSYGKSSEQLKRITRLTVARAFPCELTRQRVLKRDECIRCPIDTAMDDIEKRCAMLQSEVDKHRQGQTDLKTLTLLLKGSVDTHVHGGIPEVMEAFLPTTDDDSCMLIDASGQPMAPLKSAHKQQELARMLISFLTLCSQCLRISGEAFRVLAGSADDALSPLQCEFEKSFAALAASAKARLAHVPLMQDEAFDQELLTQLAAL